MHPKNPWSMSKTCFTTVDSIFNWNDSTLYSFPLFFRYKPVVWDSTRHVTNKSVSSALGSTGLWSLSVFITVSTIGLSASPVHFIAVSLGFALILSLRRLLKPCLFLGFVRKTVASRSSTVSSWTTKSRVVVGFIWCWMYLFGVLSSYPSNTTMISWESLVCRVRWEAYSFLMPPIVFPSVQRLRRFWINIPSS